MFQVFPFSFRLGFKPSRARRSMRFHVRRNIGQGPSACKCLPIRFGDLESGRMNALGMKVRDSTRVQNSGLMAQDLRFVFSTGFFHVYRAPGIM